jgi:dihydroxyacetone kinase
MRKLINRPEKVVSDMVAGLTLVYGGLQRLPDENVILRFDSDAVRHTNVAVISGGGSGHEPAHAGYVGAGMLSAAVLGDVFTSPSTDAVLAAIHAVSGDAGTLLVIKNYTGDRLNFQLAAEIARGEGYEVETALVGDDVSLPLCEDLAGRRGLAGTVLVEKVAGAAAAEGLPLAEVAQVARGTAARVATMGVALGACTIPAGGIPSFALPDTEMEVGLGIHGEPGVERCPVEPADNVVERLVEKILREAPRQQDERIVLMVNNLGGTTNMELAIVARHAIELLEELQTTVERVYMGTFLSSLEMPGVSISVLRAVDDRILAFLDARTSAPAWPNSAAMPRTPPVCTLSTGSPWLRLDPTRETSWRGAVPSIADGIRRAASALIAAETRLTQLDRQVGDGDIGISLERGARAVLTTLDELQEESPAAMFRALGVLLRREVGGTSGSLYGAFLLSVGASLSKSLRADLVCCADALDAGIAGITEFGGARRGDRTMLDALIPAAEILREQLVAERPLRDALLAAAAAGRSGADATAVMTARRGRSSYLGTRVIGINDPGAEAVAIWLEAIAQPEPESSEA